MMTADQIIDGCGGTSAVADALDLTASTVSSWKSANFIPRWWRNHVLRVAKKKGFALTGDDFPTVEQRKSRPQPDARAA